MIDAAVSYMGSEAPSFMETEEGEGRTHFFHAAVAVIFLVKALAGIFESVLKETVGQQAVFGQVSIEITCHLLGDDAAGHLTFLMATHTVAKDEDAPALLGVGGIDVILLIGPLAHLEDELGLTQSDFHAGEDFFRKMSFDMPISTSALSPSTNSSPCRNSTPLTLIGFLFW